MADWGVVGGYLLVVALVGYVSRARRATASDLFRADRAMPWPLVSVSVAVSELAGWAMIFVPGAAMAARGDFSFLQWGMGAVAARVVIAVWWARAYAGEDSSAYACIGRRVGRLAGVSATALFVVGTLLVQGSRVVLVALPLQWVVPIPFVWSLVAVGLIAVALAGFGMRAMVWTDLLHFLLILTGGCAALLWLVGGFEGQWETLHEVARSAPSFDGTPTDRWPLLGFGPDSPLKFAFWLALVAAPFQQLYVLGVDHVTAQRLFSCRDAAGVRRAVLGSLVGVVPVLVLVLVGVALFVFYREHPPTDPALLEAMAWSAGAAERSLAVFPLWIVTELPSALRGLLVAGFVAAALSNAVAALLALGGVCDGYFPKHGRRLVAGWGVVFLLVVACLCLAVESRNWDLSELARTVVAALAGPLLGMFLVAILLGWRGRGSKS